MFVLHAKVKHDIRTYTTVKLLAIKLHTTGLYTVKPVYNGQLRPTTKVTFVDRWRISQDELRLAFVDRKPLLAGVVMYMFECTLCGTVLFAELLNLKIY